MKSMGIGMLALFLAIVTAATSRAEEPKSAKGSMIVHCVYFKLNETSPEGVQKLTAACKKYLTDHPGTVFFAAGPLAEGLERPVNVRDFDVALVIVFKDRASHDAYQEAPRHKQFIEENKETWKNVRVFDSEYSK